MKEHAVRKNCFPLRMLFLPVLLLCGPVSVRADSRAPHESDALASAGILAKLKTGVSLNARTGGESAFAVLDALNRRYGGGPVRKLRPWSPSSTAPRGLIQVTVSPARDPRALVKAYSESGHFEYAELNRRCAPHALAADTIRPNDYNFFAQWQMFNDGGNNFEGRDIFEDDADIDMTEAWAYAQGDSAVIVAIIDSGCKRNHPELAGRFWTNPGEIPDNNIDDDGNGYIDDMVGWDFVDDDNDPEDTLGHGTAVAGFLACNANNEIGFAGVDWNCRLMALKVVTADTLQNEGATFAAMYEAIIYAADNGAHVINMSLGNPVRSRTVEDAIDYAVARNVTIVVSAGNDNDTPISFPARYSKVIAVGSTDPDDTRTISFLHKSEDSGSNYGDALDIVAPGNFVYFIQHDNDSAYNAASGGTSYSAPLVAGVASLLVAQDSSRTPGEIQDIIEGSADDQIGDPAEDTEGWDPYYGHGRLNAFGAVTYGQVLAEQKTRGRLPARETVRVRMQDARFFLTLPSGWETARPVIVEIFDARGRRCIQRRIAAAHHRERTIPLPPSILRSLHVLRVRGTRESFAAKVLTVR
ncbi:MAG: S8 family serine peptidase [Chitinivibrionales bacterium]|nr:S8 family serine peptidase [Chitinivibrionales bacterium]MBD3394201.1 S8 family serine peptidase [Chitinivibrionales bacterium]